MSLAISPAPSPAMQGADAAGPEGLSFRIISGPNRDAGLTLPQGTWRMGDGADDDILLADPEFGAAGLSLTIEADGAASLLARAPGGRFEGRALRPGRRCAVGAGGTLLAGRTAIELLPAADIRAAFGRQRRNRLRWAGAAALLAGLAGAAFWAAPQWGERRVEAERRAPAPIAAAPMADAGTALTALAERLEAANLGAERLRLTLGPGGALLAEGRLNAEETVRFNDVRRWYDGAHGTGPALVARLGVDIGPARPALRIRAVSLLPVPYIIAADGERYAEGAVLEDGWVVESITREQVILRRGSETAVVTL